jgi:hypothetical protein
LTAYTAAANEQIKSKATAKLRTGRLDHDTPTLPFPTALELISMHVNDDDRFLPFLKALHTAGWSYAALATPLKLSRQAIHLRLSRFVVTEPVDLPAVPTGPGRGQGPRNVARFDWAVWVDREVYAVAAQQASDKGEAMRDVMESILADYVSGALVVSAEENNTGKAN